mmetsp:Transcript_10699/g.25157  ORF Transcript_10699/g.25157 Transcript_10699/m.25157 type:complete len:169 (-) Transcript_10699:57-563(-)
MPWLLCVGVLSALSAGATRGASALRRQDGVSAKAAALGTLVLHTEQGGQAPDECQLFQAGFLLQQSPPCRHELSLPPQEPSEVRTYNPPLTLAECPFAAACGQSGNSMCVGFDSWGFTKVHMSRHTAASAYLGMITCTYTMGAQSQFRVPPRVLAFWKWLEHDGPNPL